MDVKAEIKALRAEIAARSKEYYDNDAPTISDYDYDNLMLRLEALEAEHPELVAPDSPTQRVGGSVSEQFNPVRHIVPLESLNDVFSFPELESFILRTNEALGIAAQYTIEPKIDGLSVAIEYIDGALSLGATRGDGLIGEDVTENIKTIRNLPKKLKDAPRRLIVRGEVYMSKNTFIRLNEERELKGEKLFANPRNAAAGSLRQLDSRVCKARQLDIIVFNVQYAEGREFSSTRKLWTH